MSNAAGDIIVLGARSVLTAWAFDLLRFVCTLSEPPITVYTVDRSAPVATPLVEGTRTAFFAHFPTQDLLDRAALPGARVVLFLDDPADTVRFVQVAGGCSFNDAIRYGVAAVAGYVALRGLPSVQILHRDIATVDQMLRLALAHFELEIDADTLALAASYFGPEGASATIDSALKHYLPYYATVDSRQKPFATEETTLIASTLTPLVRMTFSDAPATIVWPTSLFYSGDHPNTAAPLLMDLTGAARILYYGPYFHLPAGSWRARLLLGFTEGARKTPFSAEIVADKPLAHLIMIPERKGTFLCSFEFTHDNALFAVDIRIRIDRGAIDGHLAFGRMELWQGDTPPS